MVEEVPFDVDRVFEEPAKSLERFRRDCVAQRRAVEVLDRGVRRFGGDEGAGGVEGHPSLDAPGDHDILMPSRRLGLGLGKRRRRGYASMVVRSRVVQVVWSETALDASWT
jgi:hypothetical protein